MARTTRDTADRSYHHGDLRQSLLTATLEVIDDEGLDAVSLRAVARQLGVSEAAPYHHFASKTDLLAVLAADSYRDLGQRLTRAVEQDGLDRFERLGMLIRTYVAYGLENRGRYRLMFGEHMVGLGDHIRAQGYDPGRPARQILKDVLVDCVGDTQDTETIEGVVWALGHGITGLINEAEIQFESPVDDTERLVDTGIAILTAGIRRLAEEASDSELQDRTGAYDR